MKMPESTALGLQNSLGWMSPDDFTLDEIASSLNIVIKEKTLAGAEGRILIKGDSGVITIDGSICSEGKRNFVLAHEIGHFLMHKDAVALFSETDMTLNEWYKKGNQENEANCFATEFLLPRRLFVSLVENKRLSLSLIEDLSSYFHTSILATFLRYADLGKYPLMVVFIEDGIVKWKRASKDFPFTWIPKDFKLPVYTVAGDLFYNKTIETKPQKVDAVEWFSEDFEIKNKSGWKLWEQCYQVGANSIVSCLWTY
ncbi:ImmA/IrrE family metallo-endopeptidase [uncultured Sphingobacterium sp.]|uniref:ImmA/IrrE family metallo-endopeptidase n=1 Tax=uncultured Sphingobacterium sp. TaxID=182688 RepID=UPI0025DC4539|nr:ImmA/IrrE family metallo-endopeptidase [uncultured Sphingobacterium sp.]